MQILKADTSVKVVIGPVVAVGDGFTPVTTLSLSTADEAEAMKHDAAAVTSISANTFAAITSMDGYYNLTLTAAQLDTEGMLTIGINDDSLCLPVRHDFMVVNANVYDSLYGAATTDYLQVDTVQSGGTTQTANDNGADINTLLTRIVGTLAAGTHNAQSGDAYARLGAPAGASVSADIATVDTVVDGIQTDLDNGTDGLGAIKTAVDAIPTSNPTAAAIADAVWDELQSGHITAGTFGILATEIADILTDTGTTIPATLSSMDTKLDTIDDYIDTEVAAIKAVTDLIPDAGAMTSIATAAALTTVDTVVDGIQTDLDNPTDGLGALKALIDALPAATDIVSAGAITTSAGAVSTVTSVTNQVTADVTSISGDTPAADALEASLETIVTGTATGTPTTTTMRDSALTETTDDHYIGRTILWRTGALAGQASDITDYDGTNKEFTFTATTDAPSAGDAYVVV